jgi:hypothetical protein
MEKYNWGISMFINNKKQVKITTIHGNTSTHKHTDGISNAKVWDNKKKQDQISYKMPIPNNLFESSLNSIEYHRLLYEWSGKELPFLLLAILALLDGSNNFLLIFLKTNKKLGLQFLLLQPKIDRGEPEGTAIKELAKDPYIVVAAGPKKNLPKFLNAIQFIDCLFQAPSQLATWALPCWSHRCPFG